MEESIHWKILVVDDDEDDYVMIQSILTELSQVQAESAWAKTIQEAVEALKLEAYDAILIDYYLGPDRGIQLVQAVVRSNIKAPMILLSGLGNYDMDRKAMESGAFYYLDKNDLNPQVVERTIRYAIDRKEMEQALRHREDKLRLLAELSKNFVEAGLNYRGVLDTIAQRVSETFQDGVIIWITAEDGKALEPAVAYHPNAELHSEIVRLLNQGSIVVGEKDVIGETLRGRQAKIFKRSEGGFQKILPQAFADWLDQNQVSEVLAVPLQVHKKTLGAMILMRAQNQKPFQQSDQDYFQDLADRASLSIEMARLYVQELNHVQYLQALHSANRSLLKVHQLDDLAQRVLEAVLQAIPIVEEVVLFLPQGDSLDCCAQAMRCRKEKKRTTTTIYLQPTQPVASFTRQAVQERRVLAADSWPVQLLPDAPEQKGALLAVPLLREDTVVGALTLIAYWPNAFEQKHADFLEDFSAMVTAALNNAQLQQEVQRLAMTDPLTNLLNRRGFLQLANREFLRFQRIKKPMAVIQVDIDHFRKVNETYGQSVGDQVLRFLSSSCMTKVRKVDLLARMGADEFILLLPETEAARAYKIAERMRRCVEEIRFGLGDGSLAKFTVSIGVTQTDEQTRTLNELISWGESALNIAKQKGGNRVELDEHGASGSPAGDSEANPDGQDSSLP